MTAASNQPNGSEEVRIVASNEERVISFIHGASIIDFPDSVIVQARRCVLDLLACSLAGAGSQSAKIAREFACSFRGSPDAGLFGDARRVPLLLAVLANTTACEALDCDDGYSSIKGHPGTFLFPALVGFCECERQTGRQALEALVVGYEVGIRAGLLFRCLYPSYHGSGSWGSIATAAILARCFRLDASQTGHALGAAEYHGTVAPIMRCVSHPGMVKDGAAWGAFAGASAAVLAKSGFTSPPSLFALPEASALVASLGSEFLINRLYFKPYCCCRWSHPAIQAALRTRAELRDCDPDQISGAEIETFAEACALFQGVPRNSEQAQYSLVYPVAAALVYGDFGPAQVADDRIPDKRLVTMARRIKVRFRQELQAEFPLKRLAEVIITVGDRVLRSGVVAAHGDPEEPMTDGELERKFEKYTAAYLSTGERQEIFQAVWQLDDLADISNLFRVLFRECRRHKPD